MARPYFGAMRCGSSPFFTRARRQYLLQQRRFSAKAIYSVFPTTLHYYSPRQTSSLYDQAEGSDNRPYHIVDEELHLSNDGQVYPAVKGNSISNGAAMFPNTFMMQEFIRRYYDETVDREEEGEKGEKVETPYIFTIPKGTPVPLQLILINDFLSKFSLQPARGMTLRALNDSLDQFYAKHAHKEPAVDWIDTHPFQNAVADDADAIWMAK